MDQPKPIPRAYRPNFGRKDPRRDDVDWQTVEADYRAGTKPLRKLAAEHSVSVGAIQGRAHAGAWVRGEAARKYTPKKLSPLLRAACKEIERAPVNPEVLDRAMRVGSRIEVVEAYATALVRVKREHRSDLQRFRNLSSRLFAELQAVTDGRAALLALPELEKQQGLAGVELRELRVAVNAAVSLSGRATTLDKLAHTMDVVARLEREIFGLDKLPPGIGEEGDPSTARDRPIRFIAPDGSRYDDAATLIEAMPGLWTEVSDLLDDTPRDDGEPVQ